MERILFRRNSPSLHELTVDFCTDLSLALTRVAREPGKPWSGRPRAFLAT